MVIIGIDAHKYTHTVVAVDGQGRQLAVKTIGTTTADHFALFELGEAAWRGAALGRRGLPTTLTAPRT